MTDRQRIDDEMRKTTGGPIVSQGPDQMLMDADDVPFTDPTTQTVNKTYTVAAQTALADLASTAAVTITDDGATITAVTYTPAGAQAAPSAGNSRTYTLTGSEGTIATYVFDNTKSAFVNGTPVAFTVSITSIKEGEVLNLASAHGGSSGVADPGGTLTVTYTI